MSVKEKRLVESVLFSAGKPISVNEIKETTNLSPEKIKTTLDELIEDWYRILKFPGVATLLKFDNPASMIDYLCLGAADGQFQVEIVHPVVSESTCHISIINFYWNVIVFVSHTDIV
jgi:hypothetical protein